MGRWVAGTALGAALAALALGLLHGSPSAQAALIAPLPAGKITTNSGCTAAYTSKIFTVEFSVLHCKVQSPSHAQKKTTVKITIFRREF